MFLCMVIFSSICFSWFLFEMHRKFSRCALRKFYSYNFRHNARFLSNTYLSQSKRGKQRWIGNSARNPMLFLPLDNSKLKTLSSFGRVYRIAGWRGLWWLPARAFSVLVFLVSPAFACSPDAWNGGRSGSIVCSCSTRWSVSHGFCSIPLLPRRRTSHACQHMFLNC